MVSVKRWWMTSDKYPWILHLLVHWCIRSFINKKQHWTTLQCQYHVYLCSMLRKLKYTVNIIRTTRASQWTSYQFITFFKVFNHDGYKQIWNVVDINMMVTQSCPRVTFLGPDPAKRWPDPTRDCRQKSDGLTRPDPRPDPFPICTIFNWIIIYYLFNYYILNIVENQSIRMYSIRRFISNQLPRNNQ